MHSLIALRRRIARLPRVRRTYDGGLRARFAVDLRVARARDRLWRPSRPRPESRLSVVLLSFARPRNIHFIAETVLRCDFVERLLISNNDPSVRLEDYAPLASPRATIVTQEAPCPPMRRFELARDLPGEYLLALDDDVFLRADQIEAVFRELVADPTVPHGVIGQVMESDAQDGALLKYHLVERTVARVDVLNRAYFFTATHRERFFSLLAAIYRLTPARRPLRYGDDIVLSFSGRGRPKVHDVGRVLYCPSGNDPAVARWLQPGFHAYRSTLYRDLLTLTGAGGTKRLADARGDGGS